jgi:phage terminase small subunit
LNSYRRKSGFAGVFPLLFPEKKVIFTDVSESPLGTASVPASPCEGPGVCLPEAAQMEMFPELADKKPESLGILKNGSKTMRFVAEYFLTGNATQSVLNAGYNCTKESARRMGHELLTRLDIREALRHLDSEIRGDALVSKQNVIRSIMGTREKAAAQIKFVLAKDAASLHRVVNECDRLLAQIKGMLVSDKVEVSNTINLNELLAYDKENFSEGNGEKR